MARTDNLTNFLNDVATAIKSKLDDSTAIPASQFDTKIMSIQTRGNYETRTVNVTSNGSQTITPNQGYDAIESIVINTQVPIPQLQTKSYEFTDNATITLSPETGYDGFSSISLTINVPSGSINNQDKTITENGTYQADQGYTGLGEVTVNVHQPVKVFKSKEEMNYNYTDKVEGDYAVIIHNTPLNIYGTYNTFTELYFTKQNVVLDSEHSVTGEVINEVVYTSEISGDNTEYVHIFMDETKFELTIHKTLDDSIINTITYNCVDDGTTYVPANDNIEWFMFSSKMIYSGTVWDKYTWPLFLCYVIDELEGLYTYKAPYIEQPSPEYIYPIDYTHSTISTEAITPAYLETPVLRSILRKAWSTICALVESPDGTYVIYGRKDFRYRTS